MKIPTRTEGMDVEEKWQFEEEAGSRIQKVFLFSFLT